MSLGLDGCEVRLCDPCAVCARVSRVCPVYSRFPCVFLPRGRHALPTLLPSWSDEREGCRPVTDRGS